MATLTSSANASSGAWVFPGMNRNTTIAVSVVLLHVGALWALQSGLLRRVAEIVVPAEILVEMMAPPAPTPQPQPVPQPKAEPKIAKTAPVTSPPQPTPQVAPTPLAVEPTAMTAPVTEAAPAAVTPVAAQSGGSSKAPPAPPAPPKIELPSSDADHLHNPKPPYPRLSRTLNEQGTTVLRILVGADGLPKKIELSKSSGFPRLDNAAMEGVAQWRFTPSKVNGVPTEMWFLQSMPFTLIK